MSPWFTLSESVPADGQTVYIRVNFFYGAPFQATWNSSTQQFTSVVTGIIFPAFTVARWQP